MRSRILDCKHLYGESVGSLMRGSRRRGYIIGFHNTLAALRFRRGDVHDRFNFNHHVRIDKIFDSD